MKKLALLIIFTLFFQIIAFSQTCLPDGISFTTQTQIDSFQINYPGCTEIEGNMEIHGDYLSNLNGLSILTSIGGDFGVSCYGNTLTNLTGLDALTTIGGDLVITGGCFTSLTGLNALTFIGGDFVIIYQGSLTDLTGLNSLTSIGGDFHIGGAQGLINLIGVESLTSIGGHLKIVGTHNLNSLTGLESLTSVGGPLLIVGNGSLTSLLGLVNMTAIAGRLYIGWNSVLTSLTGLENIDPTTIDSLFIGVNDSLSTCEVQSVCYYLTAPNGTIEISDNASGCNSQAEVEEACLIIGSSDIDVGTEYSIYPNPAIKEIFITRINKIHVKDVNIYNQIGQLVLHKELINNSIDVSSLKQGIYVIELVTNDLKFREKLIIK
ncbi:MAG: T9SS type A sorting domain-containing protein [Bacteroidetes bacterium]|nr:T9SS type A sorting domain-containing protein [Bacteroidota bacterium]